MKFLLPNLVLALVCSFQDVAAFTPNARQGMSYSLPVLHYSDYSANTKYGDAEVMDAYSNWRQEYGKGEFDEERFEIFKSNYRALMEANDAAVEKARNDGRPRPPPYLLDAFADGSKGESKAPKPVPELDASPISFLDSPAESIPVNRIPDVYKEWCKQFGKRFDESRLDTFASNLMGALEYNKAMGRNAILNQYADWTEEEYLKAKADSESTPTSSTMEVTLDKLIKAANQERHRAEAGRYRVAARLTSRRGY